MALRFDPATVGSTALLDLAMALDAKRDPEARVLSMVLPFQQQADEGGSQQDNDKVKG